MDNRPLLIFPAPESVAHKKPTGGPSRGIHLPSIERQIDRMTPKFQALGRARATLALEPNDAEADTILVLETTGSVEEFHKAVVRVEGLEWLGAQDEEDLPPDEDHYKESDPTRPLSGRVYMMMSSQKGIDNLLTLWQNWVTEKETFKFPLGQTKFRDIFRQLRDIHRWGPEDRILETGLRKDWEEAVELGRQTVYIEIELWYKESDVKRTKVVGTVRRLVEEIGGTLLNEECLIPEIAYHALLAELPNHAVERLLSLDDSIRLIKYDYIMFFRPTGQMSIPVEDPEFLPFPEYPTIEAGILERPIAALLDGLPQENHRFLSGRLVVEEFDGTDRYLVEERIHGTAMASLILYGDLAEKNAPLEHLLYVAPILTPDTQSFKRPRQEILPRTKLHIALVYDTVRRMFESNPKLGGPSAPNVRFINFSIGDLYRPFDRFPSPMARLLDWLSWKYNILFIISAGNHHGHIRLDETETQITENPRNVAPGIVRRATIEYINRHTRHQRILSPAESINGLTVGALQEDASGNAPAGHTFDPLFDPATLGNIPSPTSAHGPGFNRSIKPEILVPGGRVPFISHVLEPMAIRPASGSQSMGQRVAGPAPTTGSLDTWYSTGTSNAAALTTRMAVQLYDVINKLRTEYDGLALSEEYIPVLIKALITHSASWEGRNDSLLEILPNLKKHGLQRWLGYGAARLERVLSCLERRATVIGWGKLSDGESHLYSVPAPNCLNAIRDTRILTVTLAWLSPINPSHQEYRRAKLWFGRHEEDSDLEAFMKLLGVNRQEADANAAKRGTVQHEIFSGAAARAFDEGAELKIQVNCQAIAGDAKDMKNTRYALAVTLETETELPIYEEIRLRLRTPVLITPRTRINTN